MRTGGGGGGGGKGRSIFNYVGNAEPFESSHKSLEAQMIVSEVLILILSKLLHEVVGG